MAWTMKVDGMEELSEMLSQMSERAEGVAAGALYDGAGIMRGEIAQGAANIKTAPFKYARSGQTRLPSPEEKAIVEAASVGIAKFNKNGGEVDTSVGFKNAGYTQLKNKTVPIPKIVNAINSGTSFMKKQPFVRKAASAAAPKAMEAMRKYIETEFEAIRKEH